MSVFSADDGFDSRRLPKKLNRKAYHHCGHQPVIATAGYSSQADQFQIGGCLPWVAQANPVSSSRSSESASLAEANLRIGLKSSEVDWAIRWKAGDNARSGATPLTSQPQTNPKYQFVNALYSSLALFETTNRVLQLVENTLIASLLTQRSLVQIQPPQPFSRNQPHKSPR